MLQTASQIAKLFAEHLQSRILLSNFQQPGIDSPLPGIELTLVNHHYQIIGLTVIAT
jgi:hypothetical protein